MFLSKDEGVSQGVREGTLRIFGRISDRRHSQCKGPVAGVSLMGCSVHEVRVRGGWKEVRGKRMGSRGHVSTEPADHCRASGVDSEGVAAPGG